MKRLLNLELTSCQNCPYFKYDPHYSMKQDSGYDCVHDDIKAPETDMRHISDSQEVNFIKDLKIWNDSQVTNNPMPESDKPIDPNVVLFEKYCPLPKID